MSRVYGWRVGEISLNGSAGWLWLPCNGIIGPAGPRALRQLAGGGPALAEAGDVRVYDASSGELPRMCRPEVGSLNDVTITKDAVYVTDSTVSELVVISLPADGSLPSTATNLPLTGDFEPTPGLNLNGILSSDDVLIVGQAGQASCSGLIRPPALRMRWSSAVRACPDQR
jgi:hypothetical protein